MGYTTDFEGKFSLDKPLHPKLQDFLIGLATTRRMKRNTKKIYGTEGEFFVYNRENYGQEHTPDIVDYNSPPSTQPALWCQWEISKDRLHIQWDGNEKFYNYVEWLEYIVDKILAPNGYVLNGEVKWQGEDMNDRGLLVCKNNKITTQGLE